MALGGSLNESSVAARRSQSTASRSPFHTAILTWRGGTRLRFDGPVASSSNDNGGLWALLKHSHWI
jgi:hypothetical protein